MCFGSGGDDSASREMIQMQKDEAKRIAQKEAAREKRITGGLATIRNMFQGAPVMANVANKFNVKAPGAGTKAGGAVSGLPAGYSYVQVAAPAPKATPKKAATGSGGSSVHGQRSTGVQYQGGRDAEQKAFHNTGGQSKYGGQPSHEGGGIQSFGEFARLVSPTPKVWAIQGPDGKIHQIGEDIAYNTQRDTGQKKGDWQTQFYNDFKQKMLDYYTPQVAEQFGKAANETLFRHARAGTGSSTANIINVADLAKQKGIREGEVQAKAEAGAADLKSQVGAAKTAAEAQLYATENPEVAANQAASAIQNIAAKEPETTPLGEIFNIAAIGGANLLKGAANASRYQGGYGTGSIGRNQKIV